MIKVAVMLMMLLILIVIFASLKWPDYKNLKDNNSQANPDLTWRDVQHIMVRGFHHFQRGILECGMKSELNQIRLNLVFR